MTRENDFIRNLTARFPPRPPVEIGIGDDGAVLKCPPGERLVVVTDLLLDGVHFDLKQCSAFLAGRKAVAVNLSDLAAMACEPTAAFISLAVPQGTPASFLDELYSGIESLTNEYGFCLAGGDTNSWNDSFAINVCLTGRPMKRHPVLRSTACPGDSLFVTGPLGGSLRHGRHLTFTPRLDAARWLVENSTVHAMMDLSDGLSMDLHRMMEASRTAAYLDAACIPVHSDVPDSLSCDERVQAALSDGEDFELLVSIPDFEASSLPARAARAGLMFTRVGHVTEGRTIVIRDEQGVERPLAVTGWEH